MSRTAVPVSKTFGAASAALLTATATMLGGCSVLAKLPGLGGSSGAARISPDEMTRVEPLPGRRRVAAMKPSWCKAIAAESVQYVQGSNIARYVKAMIEKDPWQYARYVARDVCAAPDDPSIQEQTGYFMQQLVNGSGASVSDLEAFLLYFANEDVYAKHRDQACAKITVSDEASSYDKLTIEVTRALVGCDAAPAWFYTADTDPTRLVDDRPSAPSETVRVYAQLHCATANKKFDDPYRLAAYVECRLDDAPVNVEKLERELEPYGTLAQIAGRISVPTVKIERAAREARLAEMVKTEPAYQTLIYDAPAKAWKDWHEAYAAHAAIFDEAAAFLRIIDGPSKKAVDGCMAPAWKSLSGYVTSRKARTPLEVRRLLSDYAGGRAVAHVRACAELSGDSSLANTMSYLQRVSPTREGPRAAARVAFLQALRGIQADRSKLLEGFGDSRILGSASERDALDLGGGAKVEIVKKASRKGRDLVVEFKPHRRKDNILSCRRTNRQLGWNDDGTIRWEEDCKVVGTQWLDDNVRDATFDALLGAGIRPGAAVRAAGVPIEVWADKNQKKLVAYLGIPLS